MDNWSQIKEIFPGDKPAAKQEYERLLEFWKRADAGLPELTEAPR